MKIMVFVKSVMKVKDRIITQREGSSKGNELKLDQIALIAAF